jgi:hypothetical protein
MLKGGRLPHQVYLATFDKPRYEKEIGDLIYKVKRETYSKLIGENGAIKKCEEKLKWIEDVTDAIPKKDEHGFWRRRYYLASIEPLLEKIRPDIMPEHEYFYKTVLNSKAFRYSVRRDAGGEIINPLMDSFELVLSKLDSWFFSSEFLRMKDRSFDENCRKLHSKDDYEDVINRLKNDTEYLNYLKDFVPKMLGKDTPLDVIEDFPRLIVFPGYISDFYPPFSEVGKQFCFAKSMMNIFPKF